MEENKIENINETENNGEKKKCKYCGAEINADAEACSFCGAKQKFPVFLAFVATLAAIVVIVIITTSIAKKSGYKTHYIAPVQTEEPTEHPSEQPTSAVEENTDQVEALKKANEYGKQGLSAFQIYLKLTSDRGGKFSADAADFAIQNMDRFKDTSNEEKTDESHSSKNNANIIPSEYTAALNKAKSYNEFMHMSKARLYDQLTSEYGEKFTTEAAQYAVDNLDADYNYNALHKAKEYQKTMDMSPARIYDQLTSQYGEKFTPEEAQYAIEHLDD